MPHYPSPTPTLLWCHPPSSHSPAKGSLTPTPTPGHRRVAAPSSSDRDRRRIQEGTDGAIPGDSKVSLLFGARGRRLRTSQVPGIGAAPRSRGGWVGGGGRRVGATGVQPWAPQIREPARLGQGQPG